MCLSVPPSQASKQLPVLQSAASMKGRRRETIKFQQRQGWHLSAQNHEPGLRLASNSSNAIC